MRGGIGDALGMVAGARGDHSAVELLLAELRDLVISAAELICPGALHVLGLEPNAIAGRGAEIRALDELGLERDLLNLLGSLLKRLKGEHLGHGGSNRRCEYKKPGRRDVRACYFLVEMKGFEPSASALRRQRSPS